MANWLLHLVRSCCQKKSLQLFSSQPIKDYGRVNNSFYYIFKAKNIQLMRKKRAQKEQW